MIRPLRRLAVVLAGVAVLSVPMLPSAAQAPVSRPVAAAVGNPVLRIGAHGPWVTSLQQRLNDLDSNICPIWEPCRVDYRVDVDGIFGLDTRHAVLIFQRQEMLLADGIVGPKTWQRLYAPRPRCEAARLGLIAAGASTSEVDFGVNVARRESQCSLAQIVYRPSTGDYSYSAFGINLLGPLAARADPSSRSFIAPRWAYTASWRLSAKAFLKLLRTSGACHWVKRNPVTGHPYCS